jgi:hypothetical protein
VRAAKKNGIWRFAPEPGGRLLHVLKAHRDMEPRHQPALPLSPTAGRAGYCQRKQPQTTHHHHIPATVTITRERHAFEGRSLPALSSIRRRGVLLLLVSLPDGSRALIPAKWTDWNEVAASPEEGASPNDLGRIDDLLHLRKVLDALIGRLG